MSKSLEVTRAQLRRYLLPDQAVSGEQDDGDHFPRSKLMRFAFNPRNRSLLMLSGSVVAALLGRMVGNRPMSLAAGISRLFTRRG